VIARKSTWQLQEAKNKLSEVIRRAREEGPQTITVRGEDAVVLARAPRGPVRREFSENLWEFFQRSPAAGIDFVVPHLWDVPNRDPSFLFELDELEEDDD
jgi:prevent-host-death family protein